MKQLTLTEDLRVVTLAYKVGWSVAPQIQLGTAASIEVLLNRQVVAQWDRTPPPTPEQVAISKLLTKHEPSAQGGE